MAKMYFGDTESITTAPTRVWLWGIKCHESGKYEIGTNFDHMINFIINISKNVKKVEKMGKLPTIYFFNLAWDGDFYIKWLVKNGYGEQEGPDNAGDNGYFETRITEMGTFHSIKIFNFVEKLLKKGNKPVRITKVVELKDCSLLLGNSIGDWGDKLGLPKGDTPLYESLPLEYVPTEGEIDYLKRDIDISEKAFISLREKGLNKDTQASNALYMYKKMACKGFGNPETKFRSIYPILNQNFKPSYRGGWTFCNPLSKGKEQTKKYWYDIVSMYPDKMRNKKLPYGAPTEIEGRVVPKLNKLYIYDVEINYRFKSKVIPFIRMGKNDNNELGDDYKYPKEFEGVLQLTEIDLKLIQIHANVKYLKIVKSYEFKSTNKSFVEYIDYWFDIKAKATASADKIMEHIAKIMLNSLYGKFGTNKDNNMKKPYVKNGKLCWKRVKGDDKETVYMPVACFITAYAREQLVNACESIGWENADYGDTDSLFTSIPITINVGKNLGNWGNECLKKYNQEYTDKCTFFETKRYCLKIDNVSIIKCSGMNRKYSDRYSYERFVDDIKNGRPMVTRKSFSVEGGKILQETMFTPHFISRTIDVQTYLSD